MSTNTSVTIVILLGLATILAGAWKWPMSILILGTLFFLSFALPPLAILIGSVALALMVLRHPNIFDKGVNGAFNKITKTFGGK